MSLVNGSFGQARSQNFGMGSWGPPITCESHHTTPRDFTLDQVDEIVTVVQAHGSPSRDHQTDSDATNSIDAARAKVRHVRRGDATYTNAEAQRTIAGLVLYVTRGQTQ